MLTEDLRYILLFVAIIIATFLLAFIVNRFFIRLIRRSTNEIGNDPTNYHFLRHAVVATIYMVGFGIAIYAIPSLRVLANSLLAGAGVLAVAIGFASQQALSNIIGGVFVIIFKPFRIGDQVTIKDTMFGVVEDITLRHTVIRNTENRRIIIPNSIISNEVIVNANFLEDKICKFIEIGISYDSDIDKAKSIIQEEAENHPLVLDNRKEQEKEEGKPIVQVRVLSLGESAVNLKAWVWAKDITEGLELSCDLYESIKKRFDKEGIEIPFPHRTLVYKKNSTNL